MEPVGLYVVAIFKCHLSFDISHIKLWAFDERVIYNFDDGTGTLKWCQTTSHVHWGKGKHLIFYPKSHSFSLEDGKYLIRNDAVATRVTLPVHELNKRCAGQ